MERITRDTNRADGLTVGEAMDQDAAFLRSLGFDAKDGQLTHDEQIEVLQEKVRNAVLDALDTCVKDGKGWRDGDLTPLFAVLDQHAEELYWRKKFKKK